MHPLDKHALLNAQHFPGEKLALMPCLGGGLQLASFPLKRALACALALCTILPAWCSKNQVVSSIALHASSLRVVLPPCDAPAAATALRQHMHDTHIGCGLPASHPVVRLLLQQLSDSMAPPPPPMKSSVSREGAAAPHPEEADGAARTGGSQRGTEGGSVGKGRQQSGEHRRWVSRKGQAAVRGAQKVGGSRWSTEGGSVEKVRWQGKAVGSKRRTEGGSEGKGRRQGRAGGGQRSTEGRSVGWAVGSQRSTEGVSVGLGK
eukprot:1149906-Pelagomonas_calceolata.AAC.4